ncbi:hypothetical protein CLAFUW4_02614 [Fulvia fulva]|uniref:Uncharacterized protein n=1 Tax=Passalora fulva TaxID=5499 RepID=A0A9Q8L9Y6_PASFU|nr:uncharacterized protein CLAFUR5_02602 [Fulvia fulva]KAK4632095.1 hypothetical protein CLAFUR4_02609 [Fulvia fulva]KAK4633430.1 hypothetical protein CLAFUR0_02611 [Fulvia fulva]UJO13510.1 hypothetical protein CLAFUR5_02602 [Fulvia fulva]WPV11596.1 hypothetical protein CLAFUW4_02614 [Fulvia fulva]WPV26108.1 hypothetical protein CLAFUW7_02614 [Fulvia fulva]
MGDWPEPPTDETFDDFESDWFPENFYGSDGPKVRNGYVQNAFANCAIDEDLARAIFEAVAAAKGTDGLSLGRMTITTRGGADFSLLAQVPEDVRHVIKVLSRDWKLTRCLRDDRREQISVEDVSEKRGSVPRGDENVAISEGVLEVLRRIWPEMKDVRNVDHLKRASIPLQTVDLPE